MMPLFSIGVTTYDRIDLLRETINSILNQTFSDFEVIISNDNPNRIISFDLLKTSDPRIRIINQKENLGEYSNMNFLLSNAKGKFFTWLADDDLYDSHFLEEVNKAIIKYGDASCFFSTYNVIEELEILPCDKEYSYNNHLLKGSDFLNMYTKGNIKVIGVMGVFEKKYLISIGGLEDISNDNKGLYCEYMMIIKTGLLDSVCYIDSPLVHYRNHHNSWGCSNIDVDLYKRAGRNLVNRCIEILKQQDLKINYRENLAYFLKLVINNVDAKLYLKNGVRSRIELLKYIISILKEINLNIFNRLSIISIGLIFQFINNILIEYRYNILIHIKDILSRLYQHLFLVKTTNDKIIK